MNKILRRDEVINLDSNSTFKVEDNVDIKLYIFGGFDIEFIIGENSRVCIHHFNIDRDSSVNIYMRGVKSYIDYYYSMISKESHNISVSLYHECSDTYSNIYNNLVNVFNNKLRLDVVGKVYKNSYRCSCNQMNQIININDGCSVIEPKLLIDCYDGVSSHSAYIGSFDKEKLFYLMSRGISYEGCLYLLLKAMLVGDVSDDKVSFFLEEIENIKR